MTVYEPDPEVLKRLMAFTYEEFAHARLAVRMYSEVLETEVSLVSDASLADRVEGEAYTPDEIRGLARIRDALKPHYQERLRKIHDAKRIFEGRILEKDSEERALGAAPRGGAGKRSGQGRS